MKKTIVYIFALLFINSSWALAQVPTPKHGLVYTSVQQAIQKQGTLLNLRNQELKEVPQGLDKLPQLKFLNLMKNKLTTWHPSIFALPQLEVLNIRQNKLTDLPEDIHKLTQLKRLNLAKNKIKGLPQSIGKLKNLRLLHQWSIN
jgi:Leucine-rich repeat (LRR) protein